MIDKAMKLFNYIATKCFCHLLGILRLSVEATEPSEMAATVYQLTQRHIQEDMYRDQHQCENVISHCCFLLFIFTVDKITAVLMSDENSVQCHHALRHKFSRNQFIICGEWWVWRILCTGLASCSLQDYQCYIQPSEYRPWHLFVCLAHDLEETLVAFYIHSNCFFSDYKYVFITEGCLCFLISEVIFRDQQEFTFQGHL